MKSVLVTGGAGFIGSHTVDLLLKKGYKVIIVDDLSSGKQENINIDAEFHEKIDIRRLEDLEKIFKKWEPTAVIHLAANANARISKEEPLEDEGVNVHGTINLLECCKKYGIRKIVYASSAAVYGNPEHLPIDEKHPIKPIVQYGASKYSAELFIKTYSHIYGIDFTILRYSNVYGPRQDASGEAGVVAIFADRIKDNKEVTIFGDGKQTRDFIYVEDVANANVLALEKETKNRIFNISTGNENSINELAEIMKKIFASSSEIIHSEQVLGDIKKSCLINSAAIKELGIGKLTALEEGLKLLKNHLLTSSKK